MTREAVVNAALGYVGTPFQHQGRLPGVALDCVGLVLCACWEAGYRPHEYVAYGRSPKPSVMAREIDRECRRITGEPWQPADIIWFRIKGNPQHLALWTGSDLVHAYAPMRRVVRQPIDASWLSRVAVVWRYEALA